MQNNKHGEQQALGFEVHRAMLLILRILECSVVYCTLYLRLKQGIQHNQIVHSCSLSPIAHSLCIFLHSVRLVVS